MSDTQPQYPPAPPSRRVGVAVVAVIAVLALIAAGVAVFLVVGRDTSEAGEVFLEAAAQPGPDPFTTQITVDPLPTTTSSPATTSTKASPAPTTTTTTTASGATAVAGTVGSKPGLYGGTQNNGRCDAKQVVAFLATNPDKAAAWVRALNGDPSLRWSGGTQVQVNQIAAYVNELTPLTLTVDTRVTNYGFARGAPTPRQAVLQRGTAVLVDAYGVPRTKCGCGNPLTRPVAVRGTPVYQNPPWPGWSPTTVVVVQSTTVVVTTFVIVDLAGTGYIDRPAGSTGDRDTPSSYTGDAASSPSTPPSAAPSTAPTTGPPSVTSTTVAPSTSSTGAVPTLPPPDFCSQFQAMQEKWGGANGDTPEQRLAMAADFHRLTAASPAAVHDDMVLIDNWIGPALSSGNLELGDIPADVQAATIRVEAYLKDVCGITAG